MNNYCYELFLKPYTNYGSYLRIYLIFSTTKSTIECLLGNINNYNLLKGCNQIIVALYYLMNILQFNKLSLSIYIVMLISGSLHSNKNAFKTLQNISRFFILVTHFPNRKLCLLMLY